MPQIITIAHQKGGVGKSTLSYNLAKVFKNELQVGLCDTDEQGSLFNLNMIDKEIDIFKLPDNINLLPALPYDIIIIDTPPYLIDKLPMLFQISDFVLIPTKAGFLDFMAIQSTVALLKESTSKFKNINSGIVFNMIRTSSNISEEIRMLLQETEIEVMKSVITERVSYTRSVILGGILNSDDSKAQDEIIALADEILSRIGL